MFCDDWNKSQYENLQTRFTRNIIDKMNFGVLDFFFLLANEKYKHLFWWDISFISRFCVWQSHHRFVIYVNAKCHSSIPFHISVEINFVIPIEQLVPRRWLFMSLFICFPMIITQSTPECQRKWFIYYTFTFTFEGYDSRVMLWGVKKSTSYFEN